MNTNPRPSSQAACGLCGAAILDFDLHRAVCQPCMPHQFIAQWGRCGTCGHAQAAVCHAATSSPPPVYAHTADCACNLCRWSKAPADSDPTGEAQR